MGTYLSTPVTDKCEESGDSLECPDVPCSWGVVDMQGWRKSMEDAHVAITDIPLSKEDGKSDAKVFGVFDGHGGPEVARFCGLYLVSVLTQQQSWTTGVPLALEDGPPEESKVGLALRLVAAGGITFTTFLLRKQRCSLHFVRQQLQFTSSGTPFRFSLQQLPVRFRVYTL